MDSEIACDLDSVDMEVEACAPKECANTIDPCLAKELRVVVERLSDSDTDRSLETVKSGNVSDNERRFWLKRPGPPGGGDSESESDSMNVTGGTSTPKVTKSVKGRGRGRPPTTGQYVGLAKAKQSLNAARREEFLLDATEEVTQAVEKTRRTRVTHPSCMAGLLAGEVDDQLASSLNKQVLDCVNVIKTVSRKSSHLSGPFQKSLNEAAQYIVEAVEVLRKRSISEETAKLQADNTRLQAELGGLRKEFAELRAEMRQSRPVIEPREGSGQLDVEGLSRAIMLQVGTMINARLEALEGRLLPETRLRPPLAADRARERKAEAVSEHMEPTMAQECMTEASTSSQTPVGPTLKTRKGKKPKKGSLAAAEAASAQVPRSLPPACPSQGEAWKKVAGKGKKQASKQTDTRAAGISAPVNPVPKVTAPPPPPKKMAPNTGLKAKLRTPRSAAITLTLQPGAEEKGVTYASLLTEAKERIDLKVLGIDQLRFRTAATGARMLEVPGNTGAEKADSLAEKLREVLGTDLVRVQRPMKCADIRVTELDDSVTAREVALAVANEGGCTADAIKAGEISARGSLWLSCPVAAAKKVVEVGRLKVGWVSARVTLLDPKPLRCYRCLEAGHVANKCKAEANRVNPCFRCGKCDHRARECHAEPHCAICAAAGKPATHRVGGKGCPDSKGPKKGRRGRSKRGKTREGPKAAQSSQREATQEDPMDTAI